MTFTGKIVVTNLLAGSPGAPASDVTLADPLACRFNTIIGIGMSPDGDTMYVLEGEFGIGDGTYPLQTIRKITGFHSGTLVTTATWATVHGLGVTSGQIRVGTSGKVYYCEQTALEADHSQMGLGNIAYFNPDASYGGHILDHQVSCLGGFDFSTNEITFFYSWTRKSGGWWDWWGGRKDVGGAQNDQYFDSTDHGAGDFAGYLGGAFQAGSGYPPGVYTAFRGAAGMWLDPDTGRDFWVTTGLDTFNWVKAYPAINYTDALFPDRTGGPPPTVTDTAILTGIQGWDGFTSGEKYVAFCDIGGGDFWVYDMIDWTTMTQAYTGAEWVVPTGYSWAEGQGGGYFTSGNKKLYYHDKGAIYEFYLLMHNEIPLRHRQGDSAIRHKQPRNRATGNSLRINKQGAHN